MPRQLPDVGNAPALTAALSRERRGVAMARTGVRRRGIGWLARRARCSLQEASSFATRRRVMASSSQMAARGCARGAGPGIRAGPSSAVLLRCSVTRRPTMAPSRSSNSDGASPFAMKAAPAASKSGSAVPSMPDRLTTRAFGAMLNNPPSDGGWIARSRLRSQEHEDPPSPEGADSACREWFGLYY
jgi:hypothetical protein